MENLSKEIYPSDDFISFKFEEEMDNGAFGGKTNFGIIIKEEARHQFEKPRWVKVIRCGSNVEEGIVKSGQRALIQPLQWTNKVKFGEDTFWFTNKDSIIATE